MCAQVVRSVSFFFLILVLFWVVVSCPVAGDCSKVSSSREFEAERVDAKMKKPAVFAVL